MQPFDFYSSICDTFKSCVFFYFKIEKMKDKVKRNHIKY